MAIWDKVRQGIDKAGKAAQDVIDEGKLRIDAYRAREQADKAAEALGYALFRAMEAGQELESSAKDRLTTALREREAEARRLETELEAARAGESEAAAAGSGTASTSSPGTASGSASAPESTGTATGSAADPATTPPPNVDPTGASGQGGS
jgi:hypothetical protein